MSFYHLLLLPVPFLLLYPTNFGTVGAEEKLKLRVNFENANKNGRITSMQLFFNLDGRRATNVGPVTVKNGHDFEIAIPNGKEIVKFELVFECSAKPLAEEITPISTILNDQNVAGDQTPDNDQQSNNTSLIRIIRVQIYKPDFLQRHYINLGSVEPTEMYWHRRVFLETDIDTKMEGTYHALLFAIVRENWGGQQHEQQQQQQRENDTQHNDNIYSNTKLKDGEKKVLLGYSVLDRVAQAKDGDSKWPKKAFIEYELLIPVDLTKPFFDHKKESLQLFHHKMERLQLSIFHYEKGKTKFCMPESAKKNYGNPNVTDNECPYCFEDLNEGQIIDVDGNRHIYHYKCIKEWFTKKQETICPSCDVGPKLIWEIHFQPIFYGTKDVYANLYTDPLKELFRIVKDTKGENAAKMWEPFQRGQAQLSVEQMSTKVKKLDEQLKRLLQILNFSNMLEEGVQLFNIDTETGRFVENPFNELIQSQINEDVKGRGFPSDFDNDALALLEMAPEMPTLDATNAIENMQIVNDKDKHEQQQEEHWLKKFQNLKLGNLKLDNLLKGPKTE